MNCIFNYNERHEITSIIIPKTVDNVDFLIHKPNDKFNKLKKIIVDKENPNYTSINGILYNKNKNILYKCPSDINLENIKIPDSVTLINKFAFSECNKIKSIMIQKITHTWNCNNFCVFKDCLSLKTLIIPNTINVGYIKNLNNNLQTIKIFYQGSQDIFPLLQKIIYDFNKHKLKSILRNIKKIYY